MFNMWRVAYPFVLPGALPFRPLLARGWGFRPSDSLALIAEFISSRDITGVICARVNYPTLSLREKGRVPTGLLSRTERVRHPP